MTPAAETVLRRLDAARQQWWFFTLLTTTVLAVALSLGVFLACTFADTFVRFSQTSLAVVAGVWLTVTALAVILVGRRLLRSQRSLDATARRAEAAFPELGSHLINLVQLSEDHRNGDPAFCAAAVNEAAAHVQHASFGAAATKLSHWRRLRDCMQMPRDLAESIAVLAILVAIALLGQKYVPGWGSAMNRLLTPWQFHPMVGKVEIVRVTPEGDSEVMTGGSLEILAEIRNPDGQPHRGTLIVSVDGEPETTLPISAGEQYDHYRVTVPAIVKPLAYRLEIGDSQTKIYHVAVREKPTVTQVKVTYHYPTYLQRSDQTAVQKEANLEAPQYTVAELHIQASVPIARGYVELDQQPRRLDGRVGEAGRWLVIDRMPMLQSGTLTVHLVNDAGHSDPAPPVNRIRVSPDLPPTVELLKPPRETSAAPGGDVAVTLRAMDDHALERVSLEMKIQGPESASAKPSGDASSARRQPPDDASAVTLQKWTDFGQSESTATRHYRLELRRDRFQAGQTVFLRGAARDRRMFSDWGPPQKPQETFSPWHAVRLVAEDGRSSAALAQLEGLRAAIWKILERQIHTRVQSAGIAKSNEPAQRTQLVAGVRTEQLGVQKTSADLVQSIGRTAGEEPLAIKQALGNLALGEMLEAVRHCDALLDPATSQEPAKKATELTTVQDRIIAALRKLLDAARQAESDLAADTKKRPGADLPDDAKRKLEDARKKVNEFLEQQKKVIEASENLAKKPVEDFTKVEQQLLKSLAAAEDDWSKFMKELSTDLSKLPEQDFANSSTAKELVEIQTELKMAEDALLKKTVDIAVPLEQLSYERAEQIKTNIEKWLPDTPDRERWSQEESLTETDREAPMAELPGELEDLVGDLMEQEEDLFDEMEDVSSSAADSLDKGAGWDAMDGPISDMSAKGVTGNRLPNASEIGGRSGEGRQGKSSGEFVGDEAVGKGGRKTPSRLTPDPYVKGQIKDHSKDPTGGATGGGKESGQGGEGLEGPAPRTPGQRELERLAGKQAALRNKAEAVDLRFQVSNFHHTDLKKVLGAMAQVERDLKAGHYQNALRQRKVLAAAMGNVKQYLEGEFEVRQDRTANLPSDIQKEILGSMQDPSPPGWEELNQQYFGRLGDGAENGKKPVEKKGGATN